MKNDTVNLTVDTVRRAGIVNVTIRRLPLSIVSTRGDVKAFLSVCPHDWIVMRKPFLRENCLVCPVHAVTFDGCSGALSDARGRRVGEGLREVPVEIEGGLVTVRIDRSHYVYLAKAFLRRLLRVFFGAGKRARGRRRGQR